MKIEWKTVVARQRHNCQVCAKPIEPGTHCWFRSFFNSFLRQWTNLFIGECCEYVIPKSQRRSAPVNNQQLSLL